MFFAIFICVLIPLFFLYLIWSFEIYGTSQFQWVVAALLWGLGACGTAYIIQTSLLRADILTLYQLRVINAPILEEMLKAGLLFWLANRLLLRYPLDGATYGFAVGVGFSMMENILYVLDSDQPIGLALSRLLSAGLMHSFTTAVLGTLLGSMMYFRRRTRFLWILIALLATIFIHAFYNQMLLLTNNGGILTLLTGIGLGSAGAITILYFVQRGLNTQEAAIESRLHDQISAGEMAATLHPDELLVLLTEHQAALGEKRTLAIKNYVSLQAQRALVSHLLSLNPRPDKQKVLGQDLHRIEGQLQLERAQMGLYTWIWLRSALPSAESAIWQSLDASFDQDNATLDLIQEITRRKTQIDPAELAERQTLLSQLPFFHGLASNDLEDIAILISKQAYPTGGVVIRQDQRNAHLYCVVEGQLVEIQTQPHGEEMLLISYGEQSVFGLISMVDAEPTDSRVECLTDTLLYAIHQEDLWRLMYGNPGVAVALMQELAKELRRQSKLSAALTPSATY